jgi:hypothetical protein
MKNYRYVFAPYEGGRGRCTCPSCGKSKQFKPYIDTLGKVEFPDYVGSCERLNSCGHHYTPNEYFQENPSAKPQFNASEMAELAANREIIKPISYINEMVFKRSLCCYDKNNFVALLVRTFGKDKAQNAVKMYQIGTSKHYQNGVVFWQIDRFQGVRTGKIMGYDIHTGKRKFFIRNEINKEGKEVQQKNALVNFAHIILKLPNFNLKSCLFGEHLINANKGKTIAIVESEKTAIIMSIIQPLYLWVACGSATNLTINMLQNIKDREIIGFPDVGELRKWNAQATFLNANGYCLTVSDLIEKEATPEQKGLDIADFYVQFGQPYEMEEPENRFTPQEKILVKMLENNSNLANLMQSFNCKIIYDNSLYSNDLLK